MTYTGFIDIQIFKFFFLQDLAKELLETFTAKEMAKAFFVNSGSEANDTQVCFVYGSILI